MGKILGQAPVWYSFNEGSMQNNSSVLDVMSLGGSDTFETMPADTFYYNQYVSAILRQKLFTLKRQSDKGSTYFVYKVLYGLSATDEILFSKNTQAPEKVYQELGLEVRKLFLNSLGIGFYYRVGAYNTRKIQEDFSIKAVLDLPFMQIQF